MDKLTEALRGKLECSCGVVHEHGLAYRTEALKLIYEMQIKIDERLSAVEQFAVGNISIEAQNERG